MSTITYLDTAGNLGNLGNSKNSLKITFLRDKFKKIVSLDLNIYMYIYMRKALNHSILINEVKVIRNFSLQVVIESLLYNEL